MNTRVTNFGRRIPAALAMLCIFATIQLHAQDIWEPINCPPTGRIFNMHIVDGSTVLAGTEEGGIFLSTDNGNTWKYQALAMSTARSFYEHSDGRIFAGMQSGACVSTDNGLSWEYLGLTTNENGFGMTLNSSGHIFVAGWREGIQRTTDDGTTWEVVVSGMDKNDGDHIVADGNDVLYAAMYRGGLYRSTDNGDNWIFVDSTFTYKTTGALVVKGNSVYAAVQGLGVYRSTDQGVTWTGSHNGFEETGFSDMLAVTETELYAATGNKVYHSTDGGVNWTPTSPQISDGSILSIERNNNGRLLLGTNWDGVLVSDDDGATWTNSSTGLTNVDVRALLADGNGRLYMSHRVAPVSVSTDRGDTWMPASPSDFTARELISDASGTLYAASYGGLYTSTDHGASWSPDTVGMQDLNLTCVARSAGGDLYVGGREGCYRRLSTETSWVDVTNELDGFDVSCLAIAGSKVFAGTDSDGLFVSDDNGASWTDITDQITDQWITSLIYDDVRGLYVGGYNGVSHSTDQGATWTKRVGTDFPRGGTTDIVLVAPDMLAISTRHKGVHLLSNDGWKWIELNAGLYNVMALALTRDKDGYYYVGTEGSGMFRTDKLILSANSPHGLPGHYVLDQNYPNPFNPSTAIEYTLPGRSQVRINVYNLLGTKVATLVDDVKHAGTHTVSFEAANLPSGPYIYELVSGASRLSRHMLLVR